MPKINADPQEHTLADSVEQLKGSLSVTTEPVFICGVNRKVNIGNFENIDVYAGLALPMGGVDPSDLEALRTAVAEAAEKGFALTSTEANERYTLIKNLQKGT